MSVETILPAGEGKTEEGFISTRVPINELLILRQPRQSFPNIPELAENIRGNGLIKPILVARLDSERIEPHLRYIAEVWGQEYYFPNPKPSHTYPFTGDWLVLVAGERRLRAVREILAQGYTSYKNNCDANWIDARVAKNIEPEYALDLQASENIHQRVPPEQEAQFYAQYWLVRKRSNPKLSMTRFAASMGRSVEAIKYAFKYASLPNEVKDHVEKGLLKYNKAIALTQLIAETNPTSADLRWWINRGVLEDMTLNKYRQLIKDHLQVVKYGQTMMAFFTVAQDRAMREAYMRKVVSGGSITTLWSSIHFLERVSSLVEEGKIGTVYSEESPRRVLGALMGVLERQLPQLQQVMTTPDCDRARQVINMAHVLLENNEFNPIALND